MNIMSVNILLVVYVPLFEYNLEYNDSCCNYIICEPKNVMKCSHHNGRLSNVGNLYTNFIDFVQLLSFKGTHINEYSDKSIS